MSKNGYDARFFRNVARCVARRLGADKVRVCLPKTGGAIRVDVSTVWETMRAVCTYFSFRGVLSFSRASTYYGLSRVLSARQMADDLVEIVAWRADLNGWEARISRGFPYTAYHRSLLLALVNAVFESALLGEDFALLFQSREPPDPRKTLHRILRGPCPETRYKAFCLVFQQWRVSFAGLELLEDARRSFPAPESLKFEKFVNWVLTHGLQGVFVNRAMTARIIASYCANQQPLDSVIGLGLTFFPIFAAPKSFLSPLPKIERPREPQIVFC